MLSIAIIDDEQKEITEFLKQLKRYELEEGETVKVSIFLSAEKFLYDYMPVYDVVFMDIEMPGLSGMDAAKRLRKVDENVFLIFATKMAQYALEGYKVNAFDYFVKPVKYYDLKMRLDRIKRMNKNADFTLEVPSGEGYKFVLTHDIYYIEVVNHTIIYHTTSGNYSGRGKSMKEIEKQLLPFNFARCNVSYLVNLKYCEEIKGDCVKVAKDLLRISRPKKNEFLQSLTEFSRLNAKGAQ